MNNINFFAHIWNPMSDNTSPSLNFVMNFLNKKKLWIYLKNNSEKIQEQRNRFIKINQLLQGYSEAALEKVDHLQEAVRLSTAILEIVQGRAAAGGEIDDAELAQREDTVLSFKFKLKEAEKLVDYYQKQRDLQWDQSVDEIRKICTSVSHLMKFINISDADLVEVEIDNKLGEITANMNTIKDNIPDNLKASAHRFITAHAEVFSHPGVDFNSLLN